MSLELLKQDFQALFCVGVTVILVITWPIIGVYLSPVEWVLRNTALGFILFVIVWGYTFFEKRQSEQRLKFGWTVRGNITK